MAGSLPRDKRPAVWPWLVMPLVVLLAFYVLNRVRQHPGDAVQAPLPAAPPASAPVPAPAAAAPEPPAQDPKPS